MSMMPHQEEVGNGGGRRGDDPWLLCSLLPAMSCSKAEMAGCGKRTDQRGVGACGPRLRWRERERESALDSPHTLGVGTVLLLWLWLWFWLFQAIKTSSSCGWGQWNILTKWIRRAFQDVMMTTVYCQTVGGRVGSRHMGLGGLEQHQ